MTSRDFGYMETHHLINLNWKDQSTACFFERFAHIQKIPRKMLQILHENHFTQPPY